MSTIRHSAWSSSGLIQSIQRNALLPTNQQTYLPADFLEILDEACTNTVVPFILGLDANYFTKVAAIQILPSQSTAFTYASPGSNGANIAYQLPPDAIGKKLTNVSVLSSQGVMLTLSQTTPWQAGSYGSFASGFWVQGDVLFLYPASAFTQQSTIQLVYPAVPLALCDDTGTAADNLPSSAQVSAVNTTTGAITLAGAIPSSFTMSAVVNFVSGDPQFATQTAATITGISGLVITVDPTTLVDAVGRPTVVAGNSWVANIGYSPFLQLPAEARNLVTQAAIVKVLEGLGDDKAKVADARYKAMEKAAIELFSPRVDDAPKIISSSGRGIGSTGLTRYWGGIRS